MLSATLAQLIHFHSVVDWHAGSALQIQHTLGRKSVNSPCRRSSEVLPSTHSLVQKPTAMPAAKAAPREVVSKCSGLRTGICSNMAGLYEGLHTAIDFLYLSQMMLEVSVCPPLQALRQ